MCRIHDAQRGQILFHPYVYDQQAPILDYAAKHNIVIEGYSALTYAYTVFFPHNVSLMAPRPIRTKQGGPLDPVLYDIADRLHATPDQVLLAWVKSKGAVAITYVFLSPHQT